MKKRRPDITVLKKGPSVKSGALEDFFSSDVDVIRRELRQCSENEIWKNAEQNALHIFHECATRVPAYKDFLKKNDIKAGTIRTITDFSNNVPILTKENYIDVYPLEKRMYDGVLTRSHLIAASSGTTGTPRLWPRTLEQEFESGLIHEILFRELFGIKKTNNKEETLVVIGFPLGIYISGMATTLPSFLLSLKGYHFTLLTSGINVDGVVRALLQTHTSYKKIVLIGHPFFVKNLLEKGVSNGVKWKHFDVKVMMCSEGFTEEWRDYLYSFLRPKKGEESIFNTYGSSEFLLMANETPLSIALRRMVKRSPFLRATLFADEHRSLPQLFQFDPRLRYVEEANGALLFTANSGIPLVRYSLGDRGEVWRMKNFQRDVSKKDATLGKLLKEQPHWNLPMIILRGRLDHAVLFYGINMYPEFFHHALNSRLFLREITGKFAIEKRHNKKMEQYLVVHIELQQDRKATRALARKLEEHIQSTLTEVSIEYRFLMQSVKKVLRPKVVLWNFQSPEYFTPGVKPKYIIK